MAHTKVVAQKAHFQKVNFKCCCCDMPTRLALRRYLIAFIGIMICTRMCLQMDRRRNDRYIRRRIKTLRLTTEWNSLSYSRIQLKHCPFFWKIWSLRFRNNVSGLYLPSLQLVIVFLISQVYTNFPECCAYRIDNVNSEVTNCYCSKCSGKLSCFIILSYPITCQYRTIMCYRLDRLCRLLRETKDSWPVSSESFLTISNMT